MKEVGAKALFIGKMPSVFTKESGSRSKSPTEEEMMIELSNLKELHFPRIYNIDYFISCFGRVPIL